MDELRELFLLDPRIAFLNHGSFGATPVPVMHAYQAWQLRLEREPVRLLGRELPGLLREARQVLGEYLRADADDLVFIPNATHGANITARSLGLAPGDEVLSTDHEYGACVYAWDFACAKSGAAFVRRAIPLPAESPDEIEARFWSGVGPRTRAIYLSHITSPTALRLPVEGICRRARLQGILTVVDAAHSPGQIPLDLERLGADIVFGNCHKWMLSPKGAGFLWVRRETQALIQPLIVSWGYRPAHAGSSRFIDLLEWTGTRDPAACLTVPAAIDFMRANDWEAHRRECRALLRGAIERISGLTGLAPEYDLDSDQYAQMAVAALPPTVDAPALQSRLFDEFGVEVPVIAWNDRKFIRVSVQVYNTADDIDRLVSALRVCLGSAP